MGNTLASARMDDPLPNKLVMNDGVFQSSQTLSEASVRLVSGHTACYGHVILFELNLAAETPAAVAVAASAAAETPFAMMNIRLGPGVKCTTAAKADRTVGVIFLGEARELCAHYGWMLERFEEMPLVIARAANDISSHVFDGGLQFTFGKTSMSCADFLFQAAVLCERKDFFGKVKKLSKAKRLCDRFWYVVDIYAVCILFFPFLKKNRARDLKQR